MVMIYNTKLIRRKMEQSNVRKKMLRRILLLVCLKRWKSKSSVLSRKFYRPPESCPHRALLPMETMPILGKGPLRIHSKLSITTTHCFSCSKKISTSSELIMMI